ncbi:hypothetical protein [Candidatus Nitrosotenuis cloacae]|uniref:Uncharacterized protein n=1 Tax=Candidatus Nitrosotenuis cloacae TaxID=1603555 RepID=A0A3G1B444_9ARCH|nr:hypothetical protein [Candidatus Nitrosotenuis cloacae]AJZ76433.2 hypothetical protein SU86_008785 [Candidatus Nitrosotenuis cloacae]
MVKSIQIYKYKLCPTMAELRTKVGTGKTITRQIKDKSDIGVMLSVTTKISKIYERDGIIGGEIKHEVQVKQPLGDESYIMLNPVYHFMINPHNQILVLCGSKDFRISVENTLEDFLIDDEDSKFESIFISTAKMDKLFEKIQRENVRNYIKKPRLDFDRLSDFGKMERDVMKMHEGNCASKNPHFTRAKKHVTSWDFVAGIFKLNGIVDEEISEPITFDITKHATFTASIDIEIAQWKRFVLETCKGVVY